MQPRYYRSTMPRLTPSADKQKPAKHHPIRSLLLLVVLAALIFGGYQVFAHKTTASKSPSTASTNVTKQSGTTPAPKTSATNVASSTNHCSDNALEQNVIVSITARHLWVCSASKQLYDSPVVTGISYLAADVTPTGTYHVYAKERNLTLTGSDSTGSWNDPVSYWMPFLYNQYGAYGFHDATWRKDSDFGKIDPNSADASHGCVELPLATAAWIYNWATVGTTVTIES